MKAKKSGRLGKYLRLLFLVPLIIGTVGYLMEGENISDAIYNSVGLYFVELHSDKYNPIIDVARWTAWPLTATAILYAAKKVWISLKYNIKCCRKDSIAVYCDEEIKIMDDSPSKAVIYPGREFYALASTHIILLKDEEDSLNFYLEHRDKIKKKKKVYIGLKEFDHGLMKDVDQVEFFDVDSTIARILWKSLKLWQNFDKNNNLNIAIYGNDYLGQTILKYGLLLNLFSLEQKITYHVIGENILHRTSMHSMSTCNEDKIIFHEMKEDKFWNVIEKSDLVIIAKEATMEELQTIGVLCKKGKVYYYAPNEGDLGEYLNLDVHPFGRNSEIYTDNNIRRGALIQCAKELNFEYAVNYGAKDAILNIDTEWNKLDGFLQDSNISSADYNEIMREMLTINKAIDLEMLAQLEHIRWCRFHYLNHWTYGVPENGASKDKKLRIHKCLCSFSELSEEEREKDRVSVRNALKSAGKNS